MDLACAAQINPPFAFPIRVVPSISRSFLSKSRSKTMDEVFPVP